MTREDILADVERIRPNIVSDTQKLQWLNVLENDILEHMTRYGEIRAEVMEDTLLLGESYRDMYVYYVVSMIDLANQDIAMYNNSAAFFNDKFLNWQKKWRRQNTPQVGSEVV